MLERSGGVPTYLIYLSYLGIDSPGTLSDAFYHVKLARARGRVAVSVGWLAPDDLPTVCAHGLCELDTSFCSNYSLGCPQLPARPSVSSLPNQVRFMC